MSNYKNNENEVLLKKIEGMEKEITTGVEIRVVADTNIKMLTAQYQEQNQILKDMGIDPKKEEEEVKNIDIEIENLLQEIEGIIPSDVIAKYSNMTTNANSGVKRGEDIPF